MTFKNNGLYTLLWTGFVGAFCSCGSVFDDGDICNKDFSAQFVDDCNLSFTDRFKEEITDIQLFVFRDDTLLWKGYEDGPDELSKDGYQMSLSPLDSGRYSFTAWCGLNTEKSFGRLNWEEAVEGTTTREELGIRLLELSDPSAKVVNRKLPQVWNGTLDNHQMDYKNRLATIRLEHCVNEIEVQLQYLDGTWVDSTLFTSTITAHNGEMRHDASLISDRLIAYQPYQLSEGTDAEGEYLSSHFSIGQITMEDPIQLQVVGQGKYTIIDVPLVDLLLKVKEQETADHPMSDEEYLKRKDAYTIKFPINKDTGLWDHYVLYINDWRIVLDELSL